MHPDFEFDKFPNSMIKDKALTQLNLDVVKNIGLPGFVSPHLYFGEFEKGEILPLLSDWSWACDWSGDLDSAITNFPTCYVIGSGQNSEPIVLMPNEDSIFQVSHDGNSLIIINSDLSKLYATLDAFLYMIEEAIIYDSETLIEQRVNPLLIDSFKVKLKNIDSGVQGSLWLNLADERCINFDVSGLVE